MALVDDRMGRQTQNEWHMAVFVILDEVFDIHPVPLDQVAQHLEQRSAPFLRRPQYLGSAIRGTPRLAVVVP